MPFGITVNLEIFARIRCLPKVKFLLMKNTISFKDCMSTRLRIQELANNSEMEISRNKSLAKISEFTVYKRHLIRGAWWHGDWLLLEI